MGLRTWPAIGALLVTSLAGCSDRLPENVPYQVSVTMAEAEPSAADGGDPRRAARLLLALGGSELLMNGNAVGTLAWTGGMKASFTLPRSVTPLEARSKLELRVKTVCGPQTFPLAARPSLIDVYDDKQLAKMVKERGFVELYVALAYPGASEIVVDRGSQRGALRIGAVDVPSDANRIQVASGTCPTEQPITIDGRSIGAWRASTPALLVSFDPGACYRWREIGASAGASPPPKELRGGQVYALDEAPAHFLETAPDATNAAKGNPNARAAELTRIACP